MTDYALHGNKTESSDNFFSSLSPLHPARRSCEVCSHLGPPDAQALPNDATCNKLSGGRWVYPGRGNQPGTHLYDSIIAKCDILGSELGFSKTPFIQLLEILGENACVRIEVWIHPCRWYIKSYILWPNTTNRLFVPYKFAPNNTLDSFDPELKMSASTLNK